jgi:hypothetical protein
MDGWDISSERYTLHSTDSEKKTKLDLMRTTMVANLGIPCPHEASRLFL